MYRTDIGYIYGAESYDYGATWSKSYKTGFVSEASMFKFGRLSDGRYYWVGNPVPNSNRTPLVLCLSEDGVNFNKWYIIENELIPRVYFAGKFKSGYYAYPTVLEKDGYLHIIYSSNKERISVSRINLADLDSAKFIDKVS